MQPKKKALYIAGLAHGKMATDVVILNLKGFSSVTDYLLICSAESQRQVEAVAREVEDGLRKEGIRPLGMEGVNDGRWALLDFNDVVVHVFHEPIRKFYDLEGLWADAPRTEVKDKPAKKKQ